MHGTKRALEELVTESQPSTSASNKQRATPSHPFAHLSMLNCLHICPPACLPVSQPASRPACLAVCSLACLFGCLPGCPCAGGVPAADRRQTQSNIRRGEPAKRVDDTPCITMRQSGRMKRAPVRCQTPAQLSSSA